MEEGKSERISKLKAALIKAAQANAETNSSNATTTTTSASSNNNNNNTTTTSITRAALTLTNETNSNQQLIKITTTPATSTTTSTATDMSGIKKVNFTPLPSVDISSNPLQPSTNRISSLSSQMNSDGRLKSEIVRKNWKTLLDVAIAKRQFQNGHEFSSLSMHSDGPYQSREIYATNKENWIFFTIILSIVIILSIIFCCLVYLFLPQFRTQVIPRN